MSLLILFTYFFQLQGEGSIKYARHFHVSTVINHAALNIFLRLFAAWCLFPGGISRPFHFITEMVFLTAVPRGSCQQRVGVESRHSRWLACPGRSLEVTTGATPGAHGLQAKDARAGAAPEGPAVRTDGHPGHSCCWAAIPTPPEPLHPPKLKLCAL